MIDRILDLTDQPARLSLRGGLLLVAREGAPEVEVPMGDILAVILAPTRAPALRKPAWPLWRGRGAS
jgi:hypothetical protein